MVNMLPVSLRIPWMWQVTSLVAFEIPSLLLSFNCWIIMCFSVDLFGFILLGVSWTLWICRFMFFINFRKFLAIFVPLNFFEFLWIISSFLSSCKTYLVVNNYLRLYLLFFNLFFFLLLRLDHFNCPVFKFGWAFLMTAQICCWTPLVIFIHSSYYNFQVQNICSVLFKNDFCLFVGIIFRHRHCFTDLLWFFVHLLL